MFIVLLLKSQDKNLKVKSPFSYDMRHNNTFVLKVRCFNLRALTKRQTCYCAQVFITVSEHVYQCISNLTKSGRKGFRRKCEV